MTDWLVGVVAIGRADLLSGPPGDLDLEVTAPTPCLEATALRNVRREPSVLA